MLLFGSKYHFNRHFAPEIRKTHWERCCVAITKWFDSISFWYFRMLFEQKTPTGSMSLVVSDSLAAPQVACSACVLSHVWLCDTMGCSPPGSSAHAILQARILEWVAVPSFRECFQLRDWTPVCLCLLHRQVGSLPLAPPGKPRQHGCLLTVHEKVVPWSVCCAVAAHRVSGAQAAFVLFSSQLY